MSEMICSQSCVHEKRLIDQSNALSLEFPLVFKTKSLDGIIQSLYGTAAKDPLIIVRYSRFALERYLPRF